MDENMKSLDHWVNGVDGNKLLGMVSLTKEELQSKIINHRKIFTLELGKMNSGDERQLRIFHHANRGKVGKYHQGAVKNSLIILMVQESGRQEQSRIPAYASPKKK